MGSPIILWLRRDLRLSDHAAMTAAARTGRPVIPVFLCDPIVEALGAAPKWRLGEAVKQMNETLQGIGSRLTLRRGEALTCLQDLIVETGAGAVYWSRAYDPESIARDKNVKAALAAQGIEAESFAGHLLFEPWQPKTKTGGFYKVYTPFWKCVREMDVGAPLAPVHRLTPPVLWPASDRLASRGLGAAVNRGAEVLARHARVGEAKALARLDAFLEGPIGGYKALRDFPAREATSRLSENLTYGEISPRQAWQAGMAAREAGAEGAEHFLKELAWREFAYHLLWHFPQLAIDTWRPEWAQFPWRQDSPHLLAWKQGRTGVQMVDAGMRELYVTGTMHNRVRMLVASFLTKHLLVDWRIGRRWFETCLIDWDPASNAMGWQWVAGSGPDAAPFFRIFNPDGQAQKFDPNGQYRQRFLAELTGEDAPRPARDFFQAVPRSWQLEPTAPYPAPVLDLAEGRARALAAYEQLRHTRERLTP